MPPKTKVERSDNYDQILDWIGEGKSSRWISRELENQFNEKIGHVAISNYRKKNITAEAIEMVDIQLKEEAEEEEKKRQQESKKNQVIRDAAERESKFEFQKHGLAEATARQYRGVLKVADNFADDYYAMKDAVHDYDSKVNEKDVAEMSFKALKLAHEISKDDTSLEDSINTGFGELTDAIKKSREIYKES